MKKAIVLIYCGLLCGFAWADEIYRWVDEHGVTHFSHVPPPQTEQIKQPVQQFFLEEERLQRFFYVDRHALEAPKSATRSIQSLAHYLKSGTENELETARAIYRWITQHIFYDSKGLLVRGKLGPQDAKSTLDTRLVVCEGYARLYTELAQATGLEAVTLVGYSKGYSSVPGEQFGKKSNFSPSYTINGKTYSGSQVKHAWNAVKIDGRWQLIDTTWGAGYLENKNYYRSFTDYYFLTDPERFIYDHFPDQPQWQLLKKPLSLREYENMVTLGAAFFRNNLEIASHSSGVIKTSNQARISIGAPDDVYVQTRLLSLHAKPENLGRIFTGVRRENEHYQIDLTAPKAGKYLLRVYAGRDQKRLENVVNYTINASRGTSKYALPIFPEPAFYNTGLSLGRFQKRIIRTNDTATLSFNSQQDLVLNASLKQGKRNLNAQRVFIQSSPQKYEIRARLPQAGTYDLHIYAQARDKSGHQLPLVLHYIIEASSGNDELFPKIYHAFDRQRAYLKGPWQRQLQAGKSVRFSLKVPKAKEVVVAAGDDWEKLIGFSNHSFDRQVTVPYGTFRVYARFNEGDRYEALLEYQGQ